MDGCIHGELVLPKGPKPPEAPKDRIPLHENVPAHYKVKGALEGPKPKVRGGDPKSFLAGPFKPFSGVSKEDALKAGNDDVENHECNSAASDEFALAVAGALYTGSGAQLLQQRVHKCHPVQ